MPSTQPGMYGGDEVRGRDGTTCRQGTYNTPTLDFGTSMSPPDNTGMTATPGMPSAPASSNFGIYARLVIPLGASASRVNCTQLFGLEIERLTLELERLKKNGSAAVTVD